MSRYEKPVNLAVGVIAIGILTGAVGLLVTHKDAKLQLATTDKSVASSDNATSPSTTGLLGESDSRSYASITAKLVSSERADETTARLGYQLQLNNTTGMRIEFAPGIELFALDDLGKSYQLESNEKTTLFGGPLEVGQSVVGIVYVAIPSSLPPESVSLYYQPSYGSGTIKIEP